MPQSKLRFSIEGFDLDKQLLLVVVHDETVHLQKTICRSVHDLKQINRDSKPGKLNRNRYLKLSSEPAHDCALPLKCYLTISQQSWTIGSVGFQLNYTRSISMLESWLIDTYQRLEDCDRTWFVCDDLYAQRMADIRSKRDFYSRPKKLQQFFANEVDIARVVELATDALCSTCLQRTLFLEPSCGDGRVMGALLQTFPKVRHVVGCEIDQTTACRAASRLASFGDICMAQSFSSIIVGDFLQSSLSAVLPLVQPSVGGRTHVIAFGCPPYFDYRHSEARNSTNSDNSLFSFVPPTKTEASDLDFKTGPPESMTTSVAPNIEIGAKPNSNNSKFDYTLQFMKQCADQWQCARVVFLLPTRCGKPGFVDRATSCLNNNNDDDATNSNRQPTIHCPTRNITTKHCALCSLKECAESSQKVRWHLLSSVAAESEFELVDRKVRQPSIVQVWQLC